MDAAESQEFAAADESGRQESESAGVGTAAGVSSARSAWSTASCTPSSRAASYGSPARHRTRRRGALTVRRTAEGGAWLEHLHLHGGGEPMLVRTPTQGVFVVEGHMRRPVRSGLLFAALTRVLDPPQEMTDRDVERWSLGPAGRGARSRHRRRVPRRRRAPSAPARAAPPLPRVDQRHAAVPRGPGAQRRGAPARRRRNASTGRAT